jgi:hypothetical protein
MPTSELLFARLIKATNPGLRSIRQLRTTNGRKTVRTEKAKASDVQLKHSYYNANVEQLGELKDLKYRNNRIGSILEAMVKDAQTSVEQKEAELKRMVHLLPSLPPAHVYGISCIILADVLLISTRRLAPHPRRDPRSRGTGVDPP